MTEHFGATSEEWAHFDLVLGLTADLLPVVSNPAAIISEQSAMKALGKTPSRYNKDRKVGGIPNWTSYQSTPKDIYRWSQEPDYGICIQTRTVRAIDIDIDTPQSEEIAKTVFGTSVLPLRTRADSKKRLLVFEMPGDFAKRVIKTSDGIIEFLATGQQFIAIGTHPGGARYEWQGGLPDRIPAIPPDVFEALWKKIEQYYGVEASQNASTLTRNAKLSEAISSDPVVHALEARGLVLNSERDGRLHITCPFADEHTSDSAVSSTSYFPANTGGYAMGHFKCLHAHCEHRSDTDFLVALGIDTRVDDFEVTVSDNTPAETKTRFVFVGDAAFSDGKPMDWIVKGVIPRGELGVVYGPPGSGKSFWTYDLAMAVARGLAWRGRKVKHTKVGYVAAEGASGFRNRIQAYRGFNRIDTGDLMAVMAATPNLMKRADVIDLGNAMLSSGSIGLLVYDTLSRGIVGGDENSAQDMGVAIANCRTLHDVTGAMVMLVHHSGKDPGKGARGSNAILGAVDVEIEIARLENKRWATVSKLKDGQDGAQFGFQLKTVPLGLDDDGDIIESCVVEQTDEAAPSLSTKDRKGGAVAERVLHAAMEMQSLSGEAPSVEQVLTKVENETPYDSQQGKRDRRREHAGRALDNLCISGKLRIVGGKVLLPEGEE